MTFWDDYRDTILLALSVAGLVWYLAMWSIGLLGCWAARRRYRLRPRSPLANATSAPGVSVLRPLKGLDTNLYENLESTFTQEYPNYEIIFSVADEGDQALPIVIDLVSKYPQVNATVIVGEEVVGVNPKVNNLVRAYRQAANDILWVLDSNVMIHPGTMARGVDVLTCPPPPNSSSSHRRVGLVHHVPFAFANETKIGSRIEEAFLNTNHAKMYIAINTVAIESCVVGKSNLYRRSDIDRVTGSLETISSDTSGSSQSAECGLPAFGRFLAEDNMIASALWHELGLRHELSCDVVRNVVGNMSLSDYIRRRVRWIRVRKHMVLVATLLEPFTEAVVLSIMASTSLRHLFGVPLWISLLLHFPLWLSVDLDVYASLAGHPLPAALRWEFIAAWAAREFLALPIYMLAIFGSEVVWRGNRYQVLRNGEVRRATSGRFGSWLRQYTRSKSMKDYEPLETQPSSD
ncbi:Ceramide glucosyltransferase [Hypsizygus marmoreus]|uniref:Ceramide glucosyltransferase n=1 Tax=Hypsizygus marmoreus TaxID=39966 RepID=A0A369K7I9_HYPMA|nr:Ceramide glucosyltransferase [Hypsizygus marmoreus]